MLSNIRSVTTISSEEYDNVERPKHYNYGDIECREYQRDVLGDDGFIDYCLGSAIKYIHRHHSKNDATQDLRKAAWYLETAADVMEEDD